MTMRLPDPLHAARAAILAAAIGGCASAAGAMTVRYQCIGYRLLTAELTPREGQIHFEGHDWTVRRVADAREARYVNASSGVVVVTRQREMRFTHGAQTLECVLKSDALQAFEPASAASR